jgi:prevent-host-death family protein
METVGMREFRLHFAKYIARVQAGERVIVSRRGRPVAELRPIGAERTALLRMLQEGLITQLGDGFHQLPEPIDLGGVSLSDTVIEERRSDWR